jgi:hypothetical protein
LNANQGRARNGRRGSKRPFLGHPLARCSLGPDEGLSPGQADQMARVMAAYPEFDDTPCVRANVERWLA